MEIQNLLARIKPQKEEEPKKFLALEVTDTLVQAAVWHVKDAATEVVARGTIENWDIDSKSQEESLLSAVDKSITSACQPGMYEPEDVIFGIPHNWLKNDHIDTEYMAKLKKICEEMALKPLGFVVILESLVRYLRIKEGVPPTAIFAHVEESQLNVFLVRLGKIAEIQSVGRSEDVCQDLEEAFSRFPTTENFPSRIIVFDGIFDIEDIVQNLNSYDWKSNFPFLHLPKIESLDKNVVIDALCIGGGSEVAKAIGFEVHIPEKEPVEVSEEPDSLPNENNEKPEVEPNIVAVSDAEALGFRRGVDVRKVAAPPIDSEESEEPSSPAPRSSPNLSNLKGKLTSFKLPTLPLPHFSLPLPSLRGRLPLIPLAIAGALLLIVSGSAVAFVWKVPKANLTLFLEPRDLEESLELTVSGSASEVNKESLIIPGKLLTKSVDGKDSSPTTGKKTVGDQASGAVTIYNRTALSKNLPKGTVLSFDNLKFTLDSDVSIASKSAGSDYVEVPGKASVDVTAEAIGAESNLDPGKELTVANFSRDSFVAKNDAAFTGGSSREVQVVSKEDRDALRKTLIEKLTSDATAALQSEIGADTGILVRSDAVKIIDEKYSAKVGDEVDSLTLDAKVEISVLAYNKPDIDTLISQSVAARVPTGFERAELPLEVTTSSPTEAEDGSYRVTAQVLVKLLPQVNLTDLQTNLKGKGAVDIDPILKSLSGFSRAEVALQPTWLPPRLKRLPSNPNNILIQIKPVE